ncbi:MAG: hypothetical protein MJE66_20310 [Proteobacteria bacterium]|nr:hypothetical protein [Pseudomonadota bacterium]
MKWIWIADIVLATLVYPSLLVVEAVSPWFASSDPYSDQYFISVHPWVPVTLIVAFLAAALWSYSKPAHALRAQCLPAAALLVNVGTVVYLLALVSWR